MMYLSGVSCPEAIALGEDYPVGLMAQPRSGYSAETVGRYRIWAADNDCYTNRIEPGSATETRWLRWLDRMPRDRCLFALAPDMAHHEGKRAATPAQATLDLLEHYGERVRSMGYPVGFALQPGAEDLELPWSAFDAVFLGGDVVWKTSHHALYLVWQAKDHAKLAHLGRANSGRRLRRALEMQVDSVDGTFLRWPRANAPRLRAFFDNLPDEPQLALA
jgi:hypothetical protein